MTWVLEINQQSFHSNKHSLKQAFLEQLLYVETRLRPGDTKINYNDLYPQVTCSLVGETKCLNKRLKIYKKMSHIDNKCMW